MGAFRFLASLLFVIAIPAAVLTSTIRFVFNEPHVYRYAIDNFDAVATSGLARQDLIRAGAEMRDYFNNNSDVVSIRVQDKGREVSLFNGRETSHLKDVKALLRVQNRIQEFSVLYAITYIAVVVLWSREITVRRLALNAMFGSALTLGLLGDRCRPRPIRLRCRLAPVPRVGLHQQPVLAEPPHGPPDPDVPA